MSEKQCIICGDPLFGRQTKYCSDQCYQRMHTGRIRVLHTDPDVNEPPPQQDDDPAFIAAWHLRDWSMSDFDRQVR